MTAPVPTGKFAWQRLILSLDIPAATKGVALALSVYASRDGSNCHPGNRRLAWALCADKKTIRRHLAVLRDELRLIERTFYGQQAGRRGLSDCYQLVVPWDLAARVKIREYEPELGTPVSPDTDQEHRTPVSPDPDMSRDGTGDSGAGTGDSGAGTGDSRVPPPGSTHQVCISPAADSIVDHRPAVNSSVEGSGAAPDQDLHRGGNWAEDHRQAELARLAAWAASQEPGPVSQNQAGNVTPGPGRRCGHCGGPIDLAGLNPAQAAAARYCSPRHRAAAWRARRHAATGDGAP